LTNVANTVVFALAIDPLTPSTLYAGTDGGVFQSTDSGSSWTAANTGLTNVNLSALVIDSRTPSTLYAGTDAGVFDIEEPTPLSGCIGDCKNDGLVSVDDILTMVNIALGNAQMPECESGDANKDARVTVDEILMAVNNALNGCSGG
jgi:hypothetical protein